ncbi:MAG: AmmeMemoRadiSam system protein B [Phycisphaerae bacterium]|nr:AmmeMemoRadiSam system protein B [Phycisphaerae bacterium]
MTALAGHAATADEGEKVRPAYCAGRWYPGEPAALKKEVDDLLARTSPPEMSHKPVAVISPHAGYRYSAPVAASGYACLRGRTYKRVIVLALSHRYAGGYQGVDVPRDLTAYATPLGEVPLDRQVCDRLLASPPFGSHPAVDRGEHSLELQLPFLQRILKEFTLVPLLVGRMTDRDNVLAAQAIVPLLDEDTLLVASSDFTHFGPNFGYQPFTDDVPEKLRALARQAAKPILACDYDGFVEHLNKTQDTICGHGPIKLMLRILSMKGGALGVRAAYDTSGKISGDWSNSVTYQSFVFSRRPGTLNSAQRAELLRLARQTVTAFLKGEVPPQVDADKLPAAIRNDGGCFVTLENHGQLRGCSGNMVAAGPLYEAVIRNAVSACQDRRFVNNPVTAEELAQLHIEISYLTPMKRVAKPEEIVIGRHGLLISLDWQRGVLLPQMAYERGWTRAEFLAQTCRKAGLPSDAWKQPKAEIYSFEAEVIGEPER